MLTKNPSFIYGLFISNDNRIYLFDLSNVKKYVHKSLLWRNELNLVFKTTISAKKVQFCILCFSGKHSKMEKSSDLLYNFFEILMVGLRPTSNSQLVTEKSLVVTLIADSDNDVEIKIFGVGFP